MTSIRDVAKTAGVSVSTVSHAINKTRYVSEETRTKVFVAMEELNYKPNRLASSLRRKDKRTNTLGVLIPDSANPFFAEVLRGVEDTCFEFGFNVFLCNSDDDPQKEINYIEALLGKQIDGIILISTGTHNDSLDILAQSKIPSVLVDRVVSGGGIDSVLVDNETGGYQAAEFLINLGHKRVGCVTGPSLATPSAARVKGFKKAFSDHDLELGNELFVPGDFRAQSGCNATKSLLEINAPPTAIFTCNDLMAVGALHALDQAGMRIPEDMSIIGFDDIPLASLTKPPLTTIAQPSQSMGLSAAKMVITRIENPSLPPREDILSTSLVERNSCKPLG